MARLTRHQSRKRPSSPQVGCLQGPRGDDDAHVHTFSEIGPPETVWTPAPRVVVYDAHGTPYTRRVGF